MKQQETARKGKLYGVGVGPGDPELLTLKAAKLIARCPVIAAPQTAGNKNLALDIAAGAADLSGKEKLLLPMPMTRDPELWRKAHESAAGQLAQRLSGGWDVVLLALGDVGIYSTIFYLKQLLEDRFEVELVPGVPSFCAGAAALGISLTSADRPLCILPGSFPLEQGLKLPGTRVVMKSGSRLEDTVNTLQKAGLADKTAVAQNCGLAGEQLAQSLDQAQLQPSYFTTLIVKE